MHAHERTLISSLGFKDPDKNNPLHDYAVQWLAKEENRRWLVEEYYGVDVIERVSTRGGGYHEEVIHRESNEVIRAYIPEQETICRYKIQMADREPHQEAMITGPRRQHIGFVDLLVYADKQGYDRGERVLRDGCERIEVYPWRSKVWIDRLLLAIEVKIEPVSVGQIIRQINLYRQSGNSWGSHADSGAGWMVITLTPLHEDDVKSLGVEGIKHRMMPAAFMDYAKERRKTLPQVGQQTIFLGNE